MGCLFGCLRVRDGRRSPSPLASESPPSNRSENTGSQPRNRLSSLMLFEETDGSPCKDKESHVLGTLPEKEVRELVNEAKFLKACGTLPETPFEIRKASAKLKDSTTDNVDSKSVKFHSWLPSTSIEKPNIDKQPDQPPTPMKLREEWVMGSASSTQTPISSITSGRSDTRVYNSSIEASGVENGRTDIIEAHSSQTCKSTASSVSPRHLVASVQCRNKSVRFDCESDASSFSSESCSSEIKSNKYEHAGNRSVSKPSPYPTPLKLSGEMQTPGTVFPGYLETAGNGRNPRIRSQYVYSVLNPVENLSQWKVLNDDYSSSNQQSDHLRESLEQDNNYTPKLEVVKRESSVEKEMKVEASLSAWLKPPSDQQENTKYYGPISRENACFGRTPGDRPILGVVATHWNENESSRISPKWWDGNGIPNSTNKYKEDQKVSWHATPFEERLEKALSEETSTSQRKYSSGSAPIDFNETEEFDTALSQLQPSSNFKSLVSF